MGDSWKGLKLTSHDIHSLVLKQESTFNNGDYELSTFGISATRNEIPKKINNGDTLKLFFSVYMETPFWKN